MPYKKRYKNKDDESYPKYGYCVCCLKSVSSYPKWAKTGHCCCSTSCKKIQDSK